MAASRTPSCRAWRRRGAAWTAGRSRASRARGPHAPPWAAQVSRWPSGPRRHGDRQLAPPRAGAGRARRRRARPRTRSASGAVLGATPGGDKPPSRRRSPAECVCAGRAPEAERVLVRARRRRARPAPARGRELSVAVDAVAEGQRLTCAGPGWRMSASSSGCSDLQPSNALLAVATRPAARRA